MQDAYDLARQNISKSVDDGKRQYDQKVRFELEGEYVGVTPPPHSQFQLVT